MMRCLKMMFRMSIWIESSLPTDTASQWVLNFPPSFTVIWHKT